MTCFKCRQTEARLRRLKKAYKKLFKRERRLTKLALDFGTQIDREFERQENEELPVIDF